MTNTANSYFPIINPPVFLLLITTVLTIFSCTSYKEYDEASFSNYAWETDQTIEFTPSIEDIDKSYRLGFGMRHVYGLSNSSINISVKSISPSGVITTNDYDFNLKDEKGDYLSSCAGDMCDLETFVDDDFRFEELGMYTVSLTHNERYRIAGIMALGLMLDKN